MIPEKMNLFPCPPDAGKEVFEELASGRKFRLEYIRSCGDQSGPEFWYEQDRTEWVTLVCGTATLAFEDGELDLQSGDAIIIPAHLRHRVARTSLDAAWIALHYEEG